MSVAARQLSKLSTLQRTNVSIANRQQTRAIDLRMLRRIVHTLLSELFQTGHAEVGISLVASPAMTRLNETFLRHAGSTDVITFDYSSYESRITNHESRLHGEIFVCVDEAVIQARRFRTSWQSELVRYIVHGVLHLLGFDDARPVVRQGMKSEENRLLRGLKRRFPLTRLAGVRRDHLARKVRLKS